MNIQRKMAHAHEVKHDELAGQTMLEADLIADKRPALPAEKTMSSVVSAAAENPLAMVTPPLTDHSAAFDTLSTPRTVVNFIPISATRHYQRVRNGNHVWKLQWFFS